MKSCSILRIVLVLAIGVLIAEGRKRECTCGGMGSESNPCSCNEIVVKAAKLPKPAAYAPPQMIAQAAAVREKLGSTHSLARTTAELVHARSMGHHSGGHRYEEYHSEGSSGCGCGGKTEESIQLRDLVKGHQHVAPKFPPITDLCNPLPIHPETGEIIERITTVIPARPGRPRCSCHKVPYQYCAEIIAGRPVPPEHLEHYPAHPIHHRYGHHDYGHHDYGHHDYEHHGYGHHEHHHGAHGRLLGEEEFGLFEEDRRIYKGNGMFEEDRIVEFESIDDRPFRQPPSLLGPVGPRGLIMEGIGIESTMGTLHPNHESATASLVDSSDCDNEPKEVHVPPRIPADPVSLALAYKTIHPSHVIYKGARKFVPEDKLAFGHRTVPTEVKVEKKKSEIPEEKLLVVDKPVVELKIAPTKTVVIGSYDEKEEAKLAELEAVEREYISKNENPVHPAEHYVTYGELGYLPVGTKQIPHPRPAHMENRGLVIEKDSRIPCGPLGPPVPGFVPGTVVTQEFIETEETIDTEDETGQEGIQSGRIFQEEDSEEVIEGGSEFLSRLRALSRKDGSSPCLR